MLALTLLLGCSDYAVNEQIPDILVSTSSLDFEDVVIGTQLTLTFTVENAGQGVLDLEEVALTDGSDPDLSLVSVSQDTIKRGEEAEISVRFAPVDTGQALGALEIYSDDPDGPKQTLEILGYGVEPEIDIDPETLWFGDVPAGSSTTLTVDINARGQGRLRVDAMAFEADEAAAFSYVLPDSVELPYKLDAGSGFSFDVTFAPTDETPWDGRLLISSNDPNEQIASVRLLGNADGVGGAPEVEITSPDYGNQLMEGEEVTLEGQVVDVDSAPSSVVALWYANETVLGNSMLGSDGSVSLTTNAIPAGDITIKLTAIDNDAQVGEDSVDVVVYPQDAPTLYTISGGTSVWDYWSVDDDVSIVVDGVTVYSDTSRTKESHPPIEFEAEAGDIITIIATDVHECDYLLDALVLHWGTGLQQPLNDRICGTSCSDHECYDGTYNGPWPNIVLDEQYEIQIP